MNFNLMVLIFCIILFQPSTSSFDNWSKLSSEAFSDNPRQSLVVSPLLLRMSLCKLATFTRGKAKEELLKTLGFKSESMLQSCSASIQDAMSTFERVNIITMNKIIVNYTEDIRQTLITRNHDFGVKVERLSYLYPKASASFINTAVDRAFYKRINGILEPADINNETSIVIINLVYLKVTWEFPFDISYTKNSKFHQLNGTTSIVPMMSKSDHLLYLDDKSNDVQVVNMKLASFGLSMTIAVPRSSRGLGKLLQKLSNVPDFLKGIYKRMRVDNVNVMLPRFKIKTGVDWNKILKKIGITQIFNKTHSGLNENLKEKSNIKYMYLSKCKQKSFIDVDEMGVFRQPVRALPQEFYNRNPQNQLIADRPFYFAITLQYEPVHLWNSYELVTGVYYGPDT